MKIIKKLAVETFILLIIIWIIVKVVRENNRLEQNRNALMSDIEFYVSKDSLQVASIEVMTIRNKELEKYNGDLAKEAENLRLNVRRLESASRTVMQTVVEFQPVYIDSIVYRDGRVDTIRCATFNDGFVNVKVCDDISNVEVIDTLIQFVHRVPKLTVNIPLTDKQIRIGTRAVRQEVLTRNPHTKIIFTEYIKLTRK